MNPAVEIARILLQFEVERIERQKTAATSQVSEAQDATAVSVPPRKTRQQKNFKVKATLTQTE